MSKNAYAAKLLENRIQREAAAYKRGHDDGLDLALNLAAIALNDVFGYGGERLTRLERRIQELVDEVVAVGDPDVNRAHIEQRVKEIRGQEYEVFREGTT